MHVYIYIFYFQVPEMVRSIPPAKVFAMRQQTQLLWDRYFSSVEKIVFTTLEVSGAIETPPSRRGEVWRDWRSCFGKRCAKCTQLFSEIMSLAFILLRRHDYDIASCYAILFCANCSVCLILQIIRERLPSQPARDGLVWNSSPGGLLALPQFSDTWRHYPFSLGVGFPVGFPGESAPSPPMGTDQDARFTAVVYTQQQSLLAPQSGSVSSSPLHRLLKNVARSIFVARIIVICSGEKCGGRLPTQRWAQLPSNVPLNVLQAEGGSSGSGGGISRRFQPHALIQTSAILSLDEDCLLTTDEVDFAFSVWRAFPERIVGYPARSHFWDDAKGSWGYTSKWTNEYSIVLTGAAFYHRYYNFLYTRWLSPLLLKTVEQSHNCEDILMNFLVAHVTRRPPIKVTQRKQYKEQPPGGARSPWNDPDHFVQRQTCLNTFAAVFGYMPLLRSSMRLDPVLFKDPVSNLRKKYRQIELVGS
ncbi:hypothetical protein J437_LFUL003068 [Ladona fulva]|uniref:Glycosyl transferase 64 domain-containing protein n=1 Tax=Ladona fulva TaxID=123851 RepID=A0A8K0JY55_LADFU|nr:hypothetical protein J437_LFUL003068 [Ladona fulva]